MRISDWSSDVCSSDLSGFITPYIPVGKTTKDSTYKLTDEYSRFYLKFIENSRLNGKGSWMSFSNGTSWKSWSGITFENICMKHALALKSSLGIENVHSETSVWRSKPRNEEKGAQIRSEEKTSELQSLMRSS